MCVCVLVTQSCQSLCDPMDCSLAVHEILQARILEWVDISFSRGSSRHRNPALAGRFFTAEPPGKPNQPNKVFLKTVSFNSSLFRSTCKVLLSWLYYLSILIWQLLNCQWSVCRRMGRWQMVCFLSTCFSIYYWSVIEFLQPPGKPHVPL